MATTTAKKSTEKAAIVNDPAPGEGNEWTGTRLFLLGVLAMAIALNILNFISGTTTPR
jgi:hypothetical protein